MLVANVACSVLAVVKNDLTSPDPVSRADMLRIWGYNAVWFLVTDVAKLAMGWALGE